MEKGKESSRADTVKLGDESDSRRPRAATTTASALGRAACPAETSLEVVKEVLDATPRGTFALTGIREEASSSDRIAVHHGLIVDSLATPLADNLRRHLRVRVPIRSV